jgi:sugar lactone lactonase YvrE
MTNEQLRVEVVADVGAVLGEGPQWVARDEAMWWVDIKGRKLFRLKDGELSQWNTPMRLGSIIPRDGGGFIAGTDQGIAAVEPEAGRFEILFNPEADRATNRFNDAKVDRGGQLWLGTMDDEQVQASGAFYRLAADLSCTRVDDGYRITNGPAFSPDGKTVYVNDTALQRTFVCAVEEDGSLANKRVFRQWAEGEGHPDGITVDAEGCLWIAFWGAWCVRRVSPDGEVLREVRLPVSQPTAPAFGGPRLDRIYVTSARGGLSEEDLAMQPNAGALLMFEPGVVGLAERPFAG